MPLYLYLNNNNFCETCLFEGLDAVYIFYTVDFFAGFHFVDFYFAHSLLSAAYNIALDILFALNQFGEDFEVLLFATTSLSNYYSGVACKSGLLGGHNLFFLAFLGNNHLPIRFDTVGANTFYAIAGSSFDFYHDGCVADANSSFANVEFFFTITGVFSNYVYIFFLTTLFITFYVSFMFNSKRNDLRVVGMESKLRYFSKLAEENIGSMEDKVFYVVFFVGLTSWYIMNNFYILMTRYSLCALAL